MKKVYFTGLIITALLMLIHYIFVFTSISDPWILREMFLGYLIAHLYLGAAYFFMLLPRIYYRRWYAEYQIFGTWLGYIATIAFGMVYYVYHVRLMDENLLYTYGIFMVFVGGLFENRVYKQKETNEGQKYTSKDPEDDYER